MAEAINAGQEPHSLLAAKLASDDLGIDVDGIGKSKTKIVAMQPPPERKSGIMITADSDQEKAAELVRILHEEAKVL